MKSTVVAVVLMISGVLSVFASDTLKIKELEKRIAIIEERLDKLDKSTAPMVEKLNAEQMKSDQRVKARERMRKDLDVYSRDELKEIESLYQVANKNWKTDKEKGTDREKGKASLKELLSKYDKANRTGCALLYLGQMSKGEEREKYLKQAIEGFSDSYYGNGVQVGAYARYYLAYYYKENGDKKRAKALFDEIRKNYPNAVTHKGSPLSTRLDK
ncbi:MAG: hypothetical protein PF904_18205 [Kiritimatiellae bacterium]|nr:hypothetical protein [Kiritimatiellia bacterium]